MQAIARDMSALSLSSKKDSPIGFLDVVGADVDGTFRDALTYQQSASVAEISIAGQIVQPGSSVQLAFRDEGVLLSLDKTKICFDVTYPVVADRLSDSIPFNQLYLFRPTSCAIGGSVVWNCAQAEHYIQQRLLCRSKHYLEKRALGLNMPIGITTVAADYARGTRTYNSAPVVAAKQSQIQMLSIGNETDAVVLRCSISLSELFPEVRDSFPDGMIYIGNGQHLVMNMMLVAAEQIRGQNNRNVAPASYTIRNGQLLKCFSKLDGSLINQIQRSHMPIHKTVVTSYIQSMSNQLVFNINLNKNERLRALYFAISYNNPGTTQDSDYNVPATGPYASPLASNGLAAQSLYLNMLFRSATMLQVNFGGHTYTLNQQALQSMLESNLADDHYAFAIDHPYLRTLYAPFKIDVSRFGLDKFFGDAYGSSSGNTMSAQITLSFNSGLPLFLNVVSTVNHLSAAYTCRLYTETQTEAACENGLYKAIA